MRFRLISSRFHDHGLLLLGGLVMVLLTSVSAHGQSLDYPSVYSDSAQSSDGSSYSDTESNGAPMASVEPAYAEPMSFADADAFTEPVPVMHFEPTFGSADEYVTEPIGSDVSAEPRSQQAPYTKLACGVDECSGTCRGPRWANSRFIPWENYSYGEYIGPSRTPHVPSYRLRVDDQVEFVFQITRNGVGQGYRFSPGDVIRVTSPVDERLNQATREKGVTIMPDGSISLDLVGAVLVGGRTTEEVTTELDMRYARYYETDPRMNVTGIKIGTRLRDFLDSVDARAGSGGQARQVTVSPDGTIRLPLVGTVGVVGLSLDELEREINMRYGQQIQGLRVTPILTQRASRFIYVAGEVENPGRFELTGPTSAMQAIALAGGWNVGGNLRQIVVFRRDQNWRLMALKLDLAAGLLGKRPIPSDEIWLRDSDIILVPKTPILRLADAVDLYFSRTLYGIFPSQLGVFDAQPIIGGIAAP